MTLPDGKSLTCCGDEPYRDCEENYAQNSDWLLHEAFCLDAQADIFHPYEKSINPYNGQPRIAMTGCLLFSARKLIFLITGKNKTEVVYDILKSGDTGPAAYVAHHAADVDIFTDIEIAG